MLEAIPKNAGQRYDYWSLLQCKVCQYKLAAIKNLTSSSDSICDAFYSHPIQIIANIYRTFLSDYYIHDRRPLAFESLTNRAAISRSYEGGDDSSSGVHEGRGERGLHGVGMDDSHDIFFFGGGWHRGNNGKK